MHAPFMEVFIRQEIPQLKNFCPTSLIRPNYFDIVIIMS